MLSTFGPGTDFDGTASDPIHVATYAGDGAVGLDDFGKGSRIATVATNGASVTDASLAASGPVQVTVDITAALKGLLGSGATHLGVVFSTEDSPTGTSLDDLGAGGGGPPGVGGAIMPSVFYDPATLLAPELGGNQLLFLSFNDLPGESFAAAAAATRWDVDARRNDGQQLAASELDASGVVTTHLTALLGEAASGQAGSVLLSAAPSGAYNRLVFFTESLGTFATGYLLPSVAP